MNFEAYLHSKKIDSRALLSAEPELWNSLQEEFDQINTVSFTSQKLYLINPIRRKYPLKAEAVLPKAEVAEPNSTLAVESSAPSVEAAVLPAAPAKPAVSRPVMGPKPKMN